VHDFVIRNGTIVDGSGEPRYQGNVAIEGGRIVDIDLDVAPGREELDAEGMMVAPGFIDAHTHFDAQIFWDSHGTSPAWHGVTTAVMGNCGFTLAPGRASQADLIIRSVERAEDIPRSAITAGVEWSWETFGEFLAAIDRIPKGINFGAYIGHSALRAYVMGERAFSDPANEGDLRAMVTELESALRAGALGFSTSRSNHHRTYGDSPVASRIADWSEVEALVDVLGRLGAGVFQLAPETSDDRAERLAFQGQLADLAVRSGRTVSFGVHRDFLWLDALDEIAAAGGRAVGQMNVMPTSSAILSFMTVLPFDRLPTWERLRRVPSAEKRSQLMDPGVRQRLVDEATHGPYKNNIGAEVGAPQFDRMYLFNAAGRSEEPVAHLASRAGVGPVDFMIDLAIESDLTQLFIQPMYIYSDEEVMTGIRHPHTVVAGSDAGAHVGQIIDSAIPTHLLSHFVREKEMLTWEEAVRLLTRDPALVWGFENRGLVRKGFAADLVVFSPEEVGPGSLAVANDLPDGSPRLIQKAAGIEATLVNGKLYTVKGELRDSFTGQLLRGVAAAHR
jgi:N-acyl-D-aspartate/D-glutamate deacylase